LTTREDAARSSAALISSMALPPVRAAKNETHTARKARVNVVSRVVYHINIDIRGDRGRD
jgi:hypothetical protein